MRHAALIRTLAFTPLAAVVLACAGSKDSTQSDSASAMRGADSANGAMGTMPAMNGMKGDSMGGMSGMSGMTGNADQDFLRMMSDHHKGLSEMAHDVETHKSSSVVDVATKLDTRQDKERDQMVTMLERDFKDPYTPKVMPDNQKMATELKAKTGVEYDRTFLQNTIMHHQQALKMIDAYLPMGKNAAIKQMAMTMKTDQTREIADLQQRLAKLKN